MPFAPGLEDLAASTTAYTPAQYEAFWGAGFTAAVAAALAELWSVGETAAKALAGQAVLDGAGVPVAPGSSPVSALPDADPSRPAFAGAGYTYQDAVVMAELWGADVPSAKADIGAAILAGEALPVPPSGPPVSD